MKTYHIVSIFPETITPYVDASILGRAQKKKLAKIVAHDLRKYSKSRHRKVDDTPYGGGAGMVMSVQPFDAAVKAIRRDGPLGRLRKKKVRVVLTSASGKKFTQDDAVRLASYDSVIFLCGRYEGVDHRVEEFVADEALSIGDYVLTGGELPAMVMTDAIVRLIPGVLGNAETLSEESHNAEGGLEYPQYTKPEVYPQVVTVGGKRKKIGREVPAVLLSGDHGKIAAWRKEQGKARTEAQK